MHLQLIRYFSYMVTMVAIMFVTPFQLKILKHDLSDDWVSSRMSIMAFFLDKEMDSIRIQKDLNEISLLFILTVCVILALGYPIIYALLY